MWPSSTWKIICHSKMCSRPHVIEGKLRDGFEVHRADMRTGYSCMCVCIEKKEYAAACFWSMFMYRGEQRVDIRHACFSPPPFLNDRGQLYVKLKMPPPTSWASASHVHTSLAILLEISYWLLTQMRKYPQL